MSRLIVREITFGKYGKIKLEFAVTSIDTKVSIVSCENDGSHFWLVENDIEKFTEEFQELIRKYFI